MIEERIMYEELSSAGVEKLKDNKQTASRRRTLKRLIQQQKQEIEKLNYEIISIIDKN